VWPIPRFAGLEGRGEIISPLFLRLKHHQLERNFVLQNIGLGHYHHGGYADPANHLYASFKETRT
jgi:hypothetical protein